MSPLELSICLHYHSSCEDMDWVITSGAPIVDDTMSALMREGLITMNGGTMKYCPTEKLHRFVEMLCLTPFPEQRTHWYDPRTNAIVDHIRGKPMASNRSNLEEI